jgi:hypothetical protein
VRRADRAALPDPRPGRRRREYRQGLAHEEAADKVSSWYQELIQGLVIVGAVALYKQKRR